MESFSENPLLVSGIITALCSILATETQPNISKFIFLFKIINKSSSITKSAKKSGL